MSKKDIKQAPVNNDQVPQSAYNTIGKQATTYTKSGDEKDKHK